MKLGEVAEIKTGLVLKRKKATEELSALQKYSALTLKSIKKTGFINTDEFEEFDSSEFLNENYLTKADDIVIRLSEPNTAAYIHDNIENILVPSQFCILRKRSHSFNFEYLAWYLNTEFIKKEIRKASVGSALTIVTTSFLNDLSIDKVPMEKQNKIVEIVRLKNRELNLLETLIIEKEKLYNGSIEKLFRK